MFCPLYFLNVLTAHLFTYLLHVCYAGFSTGVVFFVRLTITSGGYCFPYCSEVPFNCGCGKCARFRLSLQIEPPKGAEGGTSEGGTAVDGGRVFGGTQLYIRAESAPCVKAHSFCGGGGGGNLRQLHRKTKASTAE